MVRFSETLAISLLSIAAGTKCPGSKAWLGHAKTQVTATAQASCADVKAEILARVGGQKEWVDPHNGGKYSILSSSDTEIETQRTTNPKTAVMHKVFTDKQIFTLSEKAGSCEIAACSESQGSSLKDFSTNYCDIRNLYCSSADGCKPVLHDFPSTQQSVDASSGQSDWSKCVVKTQLARSLTNMKCPGSKAWLGHAKTQVTATAQASCADVKAEILARVDGQKKWVDPHNGGEYSSLSSSDTEIQTQRTTNPKTAVMHKVFTDKQIFTLSENAGSCEIAACSESQGSSLKDFSTNYCDIRNLYCGSADGCKPVLHDFASTQQSVDASSKQSDWSKCVVSGVVTVSLPTIV